MDVLQFVREFDASRAKLALPKDCTEFPPDIKPTLPPLTWQMEWVLTFSDGAHIRVWEYYDRFAGLQHSRRIQFSYHYGMGPVRDEEDELDPDQPIHLRIDTCGGVHLHKGKREPHISQDKVKGRKLDSINALEFVKAVCKARRTGKLVENILGLMIEE